MNDCDCTEVVADWLYENAHGFLIPGTEWGRDLKQSLEHVLSLAIKQERGSDCAD